MSKVSVIVPAYNEEATIEKTLRELETFLKSKGYDYEVAVVDDGSIDGTHERAKRHVSEKVRVYSYKPNKGKGHAIKHGFSKCSGDTIVFFDTGLDFPPHTISYYIDLMNNHGVDVVVGSKRHPESSVDYPFRRRTISIMAQLCVKLLFNLNVRDTQVGLKVMRKEVLDKIMPRILVKRYAFDIELLALSHHYGYKIHEAPIDISLNFSSAGTLKAIYRSFWDTCAVFYRLRVLKFYDKPERVREKMLEKYENKSKIKSQNAK